MVKTFINCQTACSRSVVADGDAVCGHHEFIFHTSVYDTHFTCVRKRASILIRPHRSMKVDDGVHVLLVDVLMILPDDDLFVLQANHLERVHCRVVDDCDRERSVLVSRSPVATRSLLLSQRRTVVSLNLGHVYESVWVEYCSLNRSPPIYTNSDVTKDGWNRF